MITKNKIINKSFIRFIIILLFLANLTNASIEITECSSGKEPFVCRTGEPCICRISGSCTNGFLTVYKNNIQDALCLPSIERGISVIYLDECNNPKEIIKVKAYCSEGNSLEKIIRIEEKPQETTTTTIQRMTTTTIEECAPLGESCAYKSCCRGLTCCDDLVCKETCEEEQESNPWIFIIPIVGILVAIISFIIIRKRGEIE